MQRESFTPPRPALGNGAAAGGPATAVGGSKSHLLTPCNCALCGTSNSPERRFCAGCGAALWEPCLQCGQENGTWEKFCGVCGTRTDELVQVRLDEFAAVEKKAASLGQVGRHAEAIQMLEAWPVVVHPRLTPLSDKAQNLVQVLQCELDQLELQKLEHFAAAQQAFQQRNLDETIARLEMIHRRLRTAEMHDLLALARAEKEELEQLQTGIRQAVAARQYQELLPQVRRLLELSPHDTPMQQLAEKLSALEHRQHEARRGELLKAAQAKLARHDYEPAVKLLEQIDPAVRTPELNKLLEVATAKARELEWLIEDLRDHAWFDDQLPVLAERLSKLRPDDPGCARLIARVAAQQQRHQARRQAGELTPLTGARRESVLGCLVEPIFGCQKINDKPLRSDAVYADQPGAFFVACGLALQGLELTRLQCNLLPVAKQGMLSRLAASMRKRKAKSAWGIDLGNGSFKAIRLVLSGEPAAADGVVAVTADACFCHEFPTLLTAPDSEPESFVTAALKAFLEKYPLGDEALCLGFPNSKTLTRQVKLPPAEDKRLPELVKYEARQQIPFALETVTWDYQVISPETTEAIVERDVALFALKTSDAQRHLMPFQLLDLKVDLLQSDAAALFNYWHYDRLAVDLTGARPASTAAAPEGDTISAPAADDRGRVALLDIGTESSNLVICGPYGLWLRSLPLGGQHFNKLLISGLKLNTAQAEKLKRQPSRMSPTSRVYDLWEPLLRDLLSELNRSLRSFENTQRDVPVRKLLMLGRGTQLHGLVRLVRRGFPELPAAAELSEE